MPHSTTTREPRRFATIPETAEYTRQSTKSVRRQIAAGLYNGYRLGGRALRVDLNEVDEAIRPIPSARGGAA